MFIEKISEIKIFHRICDATRGALCRFPLAVLFFVFMGGMWLDLVFDLRIMEQARFLDRSLRLQMAFYFFLAGMLATVVQVLSEVNNFSQREKYLSFTAWYLILTSVYFLEVAYTYQALGLAAFFCALFFAAVGYSRLFTEDEAWLFYYKFLQGVLFGLVVAVLASLVLYMIGYAFHTLLDIRIKWLFRGNYLFALLVALAPVCVLAMIPQEVKDDGKRDLFLNGLKFALEYILLPLLLVYAVVLHVTAIKVVFFKFVFFEPLGKGIGRSVAFFFVAGLLSYAAAYYFKDTGTRLLRFYLRHFFKISIVPLALFCVAVWLRIDEYGITPRRYMAALAVAGMFILIVWSCFFKRSWRLSVVPAVCAVAALVYSVGPFDVMAVSLRSQKAALAQLLKDYSIMDKQTGEVRALTEPFIASFYKNELVDKLKFFTKYNALEEVREWIEPVKGRNEHLNKAMKLCLRGHSSRLRFARAGECIGGYGGYINERQIAMAWGLRDTHASYADIPIPRVQTVGNSKRYNWPYVLEAKGYDYIVEAKIRFNDTYKVYDRLGYYKGIGTDIKTYDLNGPGGDAFGVQFLVNPEGAVALKTDEGEASGWVSVADWLGAYRAGALRNDSDGKRVSYNKSHLVHFETPDLKGELEINRLEYIVPEELSGRAVILGIEGVLRFNRKTQASVPVEKD